MGMPKFSDMAYSAIVTLPYVTCGMELMHGDRVAGTKLTWT